MEDAYTFRTTSDAAEALDWFGPLIEREPVALSVLASVTGSIVRDPSLYEGPRWWRADRGDRLVAAFMHTAPHPVHVPLSAPDAARALAHELAGQGYALDGVTGARSAAQAFAEEWVSRRGVRARVAMESATHDLPERPRLPFAVAGSARVATLDDLPLVERWGRDFTAEVDPETPPPRSSRSNVEDGRVVLWEVDGRPVSSAYASAPAGGVARVSGVWTPPEERRHGYASAVVAALSNRVMDAGARCMLYTDLANPTSNAIYRAIGYRRLEDSVLLRFA